MFSSLVHASIFSSLCLLFVIDFSLVGSSLLCSTLSFSFSEGLVGATLVFSSKFPSSNICVVVFCLYVCVPQCYCRPDWFLWVWNPAKSLSVSLYQGWLSLWWVFTLQQSRLFRDACRSATIFIPHTYIHMYIDRHSVFKYVSSQGTLILN